MTISVVYRTLWRHKVLIVLLTSLVVATAYVLTARQTKLYTATSLVRVQQNVANASDVFSALMTGERLARTYVDIAQTESVRDLVKERLRGKVPADAVVVNAAQVSDLELLEISVTNPDPVVAATVANEVPAALASFVEKTGPVHDTITTVDRASPPTVPTSPNPKLNLVIALMLGLILSSGVALLKDTFSDRIEGVEDLERLTGRPVIATVPNVKFAPLAKVFPEREGFSEQPPEKVTDIGIAAPARNRRAARWGANG
jgi:capsular polysaccharide biosynthesis protein